MLPTRVHRLTPIDLQSIGTTHVAPCAWGLYGTAQHCSPAHLRSANPMPCSHTHSHHPLSLCPATGELSTARAGLHMCSVIKSSAGGNRATAAAPPRFTLTPRATYLPQQTRSSGPLMRTRSCRWRVPRTGPACFVRHRTGVRQPCSGPRCVASRTWRRLRRPLAAWRCSTAGRNLVGHEQVGYVS